MSLWHFVRTVFLQPLFDLCRGVPWTHGPRSPRHYHASSVGSEEKRFTEPFFLPSSPHLPQSPLYYIVKSKVSSALSCLVGRFGGKKVHWTFFLPSSTRNLIIVIFYYQISLNPLKTLSLSQVSFPLDFPLCYIFPYGFMDSDKGKYKGKKIL